MGYNGVIMRALLTFLVAILCLLALYGCGDNAYFVMVGGNTVTPTIAATVTANAQIQTSPTWVPPTALVGTPIPGAEATLTAAPHLNRASLSFVNSKGETVKMTVEIANDEPSRELGLMFRASMPED